MQFTVELPPFPPELTPLPDEEETETPWGGTRLTKILKIKAIAIPMVCLLKISPLHPHAEYSMQAQKW